MHPYRPIPVRGIRSNNRELGGGNVESIDVRGKPGKGLLGTVGPESTSILGAKTPLATGN